MTAEKRVANSRVVRRTNPSPVPNASGSSGRSWLWRPLWTTRRNVLASGSKFQASLNQKLRCGSHDKSVRIPPDSHGRWLTAEFLLYNPMPSGGKGTVCEYPPPWRDLCQLPISSGKTASLAKHRGATPGGFLRRQSSWVSVRFWSMPTGRRFRTAITPLVRISHRFIHPSFSAAPRTPCLARNQVGIRTFCPFLRRCSFSGFQACSA